MPRLRQPPKESVPRASVRFEQQEEPKPKPKVEGEPFEQETEEETPVVTAAEIQAEKDAAADLKKQIEALKLAEQQQRERADKAERDRRAAIEAAKARDAEFEKVRTDFTQSRAEVISTAITAATEAAEAAERDLEVALTNGDAAAAAKAQRRLAQAESKLVVLQNGKAAIEAEIEEAKNRPAPKKEEEPQGDGLDRTNLPETAKRWLRAHPDYLSDPRKNSKIQSLHWEIIQDEKLEPFSDAYYESMETHLGMRKKPEKEEPEPEPEDNSSMVSAPVSREVPANNGNRNTGTVRLTVAQREAAKMAGITEAEYAKQLIKFQQAKDEGSYGERR